MTGASDWAPGRSARVFALGPCAVTRTLFMQGKRPKGRKTLGEKEAEFLDALRVCSASQLRTIPYLCRVAVRGCPEEVVVCKLLFVQTLVSW